MRLTTALLGTALLCACGGGGDGGTPTGPAAASITLTLSATDAMTSQGDTRTVTAVAKDANSAVISNPSISWTTSSSAVATVTGSGGNATVTAVGDGTATITASSGSGQGTVSVTVQRKFASVVLGGADNGLAPGAKVQLVAQARDARQNVIAGVAGFAFTSNDPTKVIVSTTGEATGITQGTATITATLTRDGVTASGSTPVAVTIGTNNPSSAQIAATIASTFSPTTVTVAPNAQVTWSFSSLEHNVTFGSTAGSPANVPNSSNTSVSRSFPTVGTFSYQCTLHGGMTGTVIVKASSLPSYMATMNGANERPTPITTNGAGTAIFNVNGTSVDYTIVWAGLTGPAVNAHIHGPGSTAQAVGVLVDFAPSNQTVNNGVLTGTFTAASIKPQGGQPPISIDSLFKLMGNGNAYVNVHTATNPGGEIRGQVIVP